MKKKIFFVFFTLFLSFSVFSNEYSSSILNIFFLNVLVQPTVNSPVYYCQGSLAVPLTAAASPGGTLNWYGTNAVGGIASGMAPTPSTVAVGTLSYYVSETVSGVESPRSKIDVIVVADNGSKILSFRCDASQIAIYSNNYTPPATVNNSVFFDWANTPGILNQYTYSYTVNGGTAVYGNTVDSHLLVSGLTQGQYVTLTLSHSTYPCDQSVITCSVPCITLSNPSFDPIGPLCAGAPAPALPTTSKEGIVGTWSPSVIDNTKSASYVFTPNANACARSVTLNVIVNPNSSGFSSFTICSGSNAPILNPVSPTGIIGTWTPTVVDNMNNASYIFTPDPNQCASPQTIDVTVEPTGLLTDFQWVVSEAFAENEVVTITPIAAGGDYLYRLDDGAFQQGPVFEYVSHGLHSVTVIDNGGCSNPITKSNILVIDYPRFFTPNDDGFNDSWNIIELQADPTAKIHLFDRYGKLLKEIRPNSPGWNGTYNGQPMPSDDYWFVVSYTEQNIPKQFRSHFTLKR